MPRERHAERRAALYAIAFRARAALLR